MTDSFGARLRRAREQRQIALTEIAERTKIAASLFEALERDDVSRWPAGIFRRSFMRAYAEAIGLDPAATVREFSECFPDPTEPKRVEPLTEGPARPAGEAPQPTSAAPPPAAAPALRLTLVETGMPFTGGRVIADLRRRWSAAAWDLGSLLAIAISIFMLLDSFWMPFGVTALCYYVGGILVLGNTPGVCLFAPRPLIDGPDVPPPPAAAKRHRPVEAPGLTSEGPFQPGRSPALRRGSELRT